MSTVMKNNFYLDQYQTQVRNAVQAEHVDSDDEEMANWEDGAAEDLGYVDSYEPEGEPKVENSSLTVTGQQEHLEELMTVLAGSQELIGEDRKRLAGSIREAQKKLAELTSLASPGVRASRLQALDAQIAALNAEILGVATPGAEGDEWGIAQELGEGNAAEPSLKIALENFKDLLEKSENLSKGQKKQYTQKVEQWLSSLSLGTADEEAIAEQLQALQDEVQEASLFSPTAQTLSDLTETDAAEIEALAKRHGIDLQKLPNPPTQKLIEFLAALSPNLQERLSDVEGAVRARNEDIQTYRQEATALNAANTACTSNNDNTDLTPFQRLYDLKYHQDQKSQDVMNAMKEAKAEVIGLLQSLYPDVQISPPEESATSGWEALHQGYQNADKITFNGQAIDLFNGSNGDLLVGSPDTEPEVQLVAIRYDIDGSGNWDEGPGRPIVFDYKGNPSMHGIEVYGEVITYDNFRDYAWNYDA